MLPWDEWGRMTAAYRGETGEDYDELLDEIAAVCAADDPAAVAESLYAHYDLRVPAQIIGPRARAWPGLPLQQPRLAPARCGTRRIARQCPQPVSSRR